MNRRQRVRAARAAILRQAIAFVNDGNDADAAALGFDPDEFNDARCEVASALIRMANRAEVSEDDPASTSTSPAGVEVAGG